MGRFRRDPGGTLYDHDYRTRTAVVQWQTDVMATTGVYYGPTDPPQLIGGAVGFRTRHYVQVAGLVPNTVYYAQVETAGVTGTDRR